MLTSAWIRLDSFSIDVPAFSSATADYAAAMTVVDSLRGIPAIAGGDRELQDSLGRTVVTSAVSRRECAEMLRRLLVAARVNGGSLVTLHARQTRRLVRLVAPDGGYSTVRFVRDGQAFADVLVEKRRSRDDSMSPYTLDALAGGGFALLRAARWPAFAPLWVTRGVELRRYADACCDDTGLRDGSGEQPPEATTAAAYASRDRVARCVTNVICAPRFFLQRFDERKPSLIRCFSKFAGASIDPSVCPWHRWALETTCAALRSAGLASAAATLRESAGSGGTNGRDEHTRDIRACPAAETLQRWFDETAVLSGTARRAMRNGLYTCGVYRALVRWSTHLADGRVIDDRAASTHTLVFGRDALYALRGDDALGRRGGGLRVAHAFAYRHCEPVERDGPVIRIGVRRDANESGTDALKGGVYYAIPDVRRSRATPPTSGTSASPIRAPIEEDAWRAPRTFAELEPLGDGALADQIEDNWKFAAFMSTRESPRVEFDRDEEDATTA